MPSRELAFVLPFALPSLNVRDRAHWTARRRQKIDMSWAIIGLTQGQRPPQPWWRSRVHVERRSAGMLDIDNLYASAKDLLDSLIKVGIIVDDAPDFLTLEITQARTTRGNGSTHVRVESLDEAPKPDKLKRAA